MNSSKVAKSTRLSNTYRRSDHAPSNSFLDWTSNNLPGREGYFITDIDAFLMIRDISGKFENVMFVEIKSFMADVSGCQAESLRMMHTVWREFTRDRRGIVNTSKMRHKVKYRGMHLLQFEKSGVEDGKIYWDYEEVSENELIRILSFK